IGDVRVVITSVATFMTTPRHIIQHELYNTPDHYDAHGRLLVVVETAWLFFNMMDFYFGMFSQEPGEVAVWQLRIFQMPYTLLFIIFIVTSYIIPVPVWLFRRARRNIAVMFWTSILVNIGMWLERYILIVPPLSAKQPFTF